MDLNAQALHFDQEEILPVMTASAIFSFRNLTYKYPGVRWKELAEHSEVPPLIVGVLSRAKNANGRNLIRDTWAHNRSNVFFMVAGPWEIIEEEFHQHSDLFWIDEEEDYLKITWKTIAFFYAVHAHIRRYRHIFKTDDDSYCNVKQIEMASLGQHNQTDYMGLCIYSATVGLQYWQPGKFQLLEKEYPTYAAGGGYQLSRDFVSCISQHLPTFHNVNVEDANTGLLARLCGVPCQTDRRIYPWKPEFFNQNTSLMVQHTVDGEIRMRKYHKQSCGSAQFADMQSCKKNASPNDGKLVSCGNGHQEHSCGLCGKDGEFSCNGFCHWCPNGKLEGRQTGLDPHTTELLQQIVDSDQQHGSLGEPRCVLKKYQCA